MLKYDYINNCGKTAVTAILKRHLVELCKNKSMVKGKQLVDLHIAGFKNKMKNFQLYHLKINKKYGRIYTVFQFGNKSRQHCIGFKQSDLLALMI